MYLELPLPSVIQALAAATTQITLSSPRLSSPPPTEAMAAVASKALAVFAVLSAAALSVVSAQEAPAPSPVSAAGVAASPFAAALVASAAGFLFAAVRH